MIFRQAGHLTVPASWTNKVDGTIDFIQLKNDWNLTGSMLLLLRDCIVNKPSLGVYVLLDPYIEIVTSKRVFLRELIRLIVAGGYIFYQFYDVDL